LSNAVVLFGGASRSYRFPTFQELHLPETAYMFYAGISGIEERTSIEAGIRVTTHNFQTTLKYFDVDGATTIIIPTSQYDPDYPFSYTRENQGLEGTMTLRAGALYAELSGQYLYSNRIATEVIPPELSGTGGVYFWDKIIGGHLDLKTGIRARMFTSAKAVEYDPRAQMYYGSSSPDMPGAAVYDFILIGHIGTAYVHIIMENLLDANYITTSFYPMNGRIVRFGLSWEFLD
jgi:outer membrane cobalamin receptor